MMRSNQERICQHEKATGMVQDKKVCRKQVGLQDQAQWCVLGMSHLLWVQSSTRDQFF